VKRARSWLGAFAALALAAGCSDGITRGWLVDRTRVLCARVEASADATRASIAPGEAATMTWLVAAPGAMPALAWAYAACAPPTGNFAEVQCDDRPTLASGSGTASGELVAMPLAMPSQDALAGGAQILVLAAFCAGGAPTLDAAAFTATCDGGAEPLLASVLVDVATDGANRNPSPPTGLTVAGAPLPPDDRAADGASCDAAPSAPVVPAGQKVELGYAFQDADREAGESLLLSLETTAGTLDHQYFALDPQEAAPKAIQDAWTAPSGADVGPGGRVVRFYAVLRDGRGGAGFDRFAVCVK
jgi:hypothetical protein